MWAVQITCPDGDTLLRIFDDKEELMHFLRYMKQKNVQAVAWKL